MKSIAEEGQRRWTRSRTPQPCVKCEAQSSLAPASMCSTSCPNAPGSAIFLLKRPHPAKKKSEVPESAACRSKTHRLLVTYRCKPEFRPPYSSIHSTSPSPPLALRRPGPSPSSATTVAGHVFFIFCRVDTEAEPATPATTMFSRAARLTRAAPIRAFASPSLAARRSVTTNAASAQVASPVPEVCFSFIPVCRCWDGGNGELRIDFNGGGWC